MEKKLIDEIHGRLEKKDEKDIKLSILFWVGLGVAVAAFAAGYLTADWNFTDLFN